MIYAALIDNSAISVIKFIVAAISGYSMEEIRQCGRLLTINQAPGPR